MRKLFKLFIIGVIASIVIAPGKTLINGGTLEEANAMVVERIDAVSENFLEIAYHLSNMIYKGIKP